MMKKTWSSLALALATCLLLSGCALWRSPAQAEEGPYIDESVEELIFADSAEDDALAEALRRVDEMRHILLLGIDARPGEPTGRSDTMVIVTLDAKDRVIKLTSLMRDLYVEIPGRKNNRLNAAYVFGGPELLMQTIEANFGVHIENYVAVNFSMLASLIDQIGGIEVEIESAYYVDRINAVIREDNRVLGLAPEDGFLKAPGRQTLTGKQAQAYARYRYGTGDGDFGRTARQREVLQKIFAKLSEKSALELGGLAVANLGKVTTNLDLDDVLALIPAVPDMRGSRIEQLRIPVDGGYSAQTVSGMAVLVPDRTVNKQAIVDFLTD